MHNATCKCMAPGGRCARWGIDRSRAESVPAFGPNMYCMVSCMRRGVRQDVSVEICIEVALRGAVAWGLTSDS